jgi:DNA-binding response OmpR family regulator
MRVLVIDDEPTVARWIGRGLEEAGHAVDLARTAREGQAIACSITYDLVIVDLGLPDGSGLAVVYALRRAGRTMPIIIMTGHADEERIIAGLDAGADDFLIKPISNALLQARVRAALRRGGAIRNDEIAVGELVLNRLSRRVQAAARELELSPKEFALLEDFMLRPEVVVSRTDLLERVWGLNFETGTNVLDATISRLRHKLEAAVALPRLRTVRGVGFVLSCTA